MSHLKERKEPTCLNCQTNPLYGRYCHVCGQENLEPRETVWHLVQHFFNDITHFDGKFFSTVKYLLKRPGFLSVEYTRGRRASYLNPIRMYVFTSAIFFIILFSLPASRQVLQVKETPPKEKAEGLRDLQKARDKVNAGLPQANSGDREDKQIELDRLNTTIAVIRRTYGDTTTRKFTREELRGFWLQAYADSIGRSDLPATVRTRLKDAISQANDTARRNNLFGWHESQYHSVAHYDSVQHALPDSLRDGFFKGLLMRRIINMDEEVRKDQSSFFEHFKENFLHSFPKILFFSLPFFALILRLLYVRRKQYLYVEHGIFTIHVYCATFLSTLALSLLNELTNLLGWRWLDVLSGFLIFGLILYMLWYLYKAMRTFYRQGRAKTIVKYIILMLLAFVVNTVLLLLFLVISLISV
ncbi:MAG: DUF3667 domain-containing protein [Bacteroidota bacterium]|nr:DUF3667 domain-containing protein [Bacteroidota bacterium]MDP4216540.1 DUF3667 domain-containing protein [Bacteroidota bacterium]MDP4246279.1 DUF3667 domain-containing protein [Bacteroidota bacterium]MDP4255684.1 DUF3667 domain-containing protein [Bacteroidota bacterium]